ncbi:hypothetical protein H310_06705 [Aphanomyces invadans]|uniref:Ankyrin repeat domain-containing protein n=1 Tax=Aphanomyces invadans TaxID=157072 RepID=A0A024U5A7_9STRA|nr:hypothetical protein H310_06705 [Aphanomyces invadans]ETW01082.1 hypothetical protein H310_06705 [Aphanomyces invadans]|eukprot:XP_008870080.1 hypothetical protein H310_06705 [Aphanomyces invadans]
MAAYALHKAIWDGNVDQVESILHTTSLSQDKSEQTTLPLLNERDGRGNTPLMLALRCAHASQLAIVQLLLNCGANVHMRDAMGWSCIQNATLCDDDDVLTAVFLHAEKQTFERLQARSMVLYSILHDIPDFYVEVKVRLESVAFNLSPVDQIELTSWVPLVSRALPSDTLRIWKKGSNIRCDCSIKDLHNTTWKRGRLSHLLRTFPDRPGHVVMLDHDAKTAQDVSKFMANPSKEDVDTSLEMLYTCKMSTYAMDIAKITLTPKKRVFGSKDGSGAAGKKYDMTHAHVKLRLRSASQPHWTPDGVAATQRPTKLAKAKQFFAQLTPTQPAASDKSRSPNTFVVTVDAPVEMHLQVQPGDRLHWHVSSTVPAVQFKAELCANNAVVQVTANPLAVVDHGLVVLTWINPTKKTAVVTHQIVHERIHAPVLHDEHNYAGSPRRSTATDEKPTSKRMPNPRVQTTPFHEYFASDPELHQSFRGLTCPPDERSISKELKGTVTMSETFPFQVSDFLPVAQFLSSRAEQFDSLREFFEMKLPPGFPVKFHLPMLLSIRASYTFVNAGPCTVDDSHFDIAAEYS